MRTLITHGLKPIGGKDPRLAKPAWLAELAESMGDASAHYWSGRLRDVNKATAEMANVINYFKPDVIIGKGVGSIVAQRAAMASGHELSLLLRVAPPSRARNLVYPRNYGDMGGQQRQNILRCLDLLPCGDFTRLISGFYDLFTSPFFGARKPIMRAYHIADAHYLGTKAHHYTDISLGQWWNGGYEPFERLDKCIDSIPYGRGRIL